MRALIVLGVGALWLAGVPLPASGQEYRIGVVFSITGPGSSLGIPERDTALMLEAEVNARGGVKGPDGKPHPVRLVIYDDASDDAKAVAAIKRLVEQDRVAAIVGPTLSGTSLAVIDTVQKAQVPMISCAAAMRIVEPVAQRKWIFKTPQSDHLIVGVLVDHLKAQKLTRVAWLGVDSAFGQLGWAEFEKAARQAGLTIVATEKFGERDLDMTPQLTRVGAADPHATVIWAIPPSAAIATRNYADLGIPAPLFQGHGIGNRRFIDLAGTGANGVIFPAGKLLVAEELPDADPQKAGLLAYAREFEARYGPRNTFGGHSWDALRIVLHAMERAGTDRARLRTAIEGTRGFVGITGVFDFSPTDHNGLDRRAAVMIRIDDGQWRLVR